MKRLFITLSMIFLWVGIAFGQAPSGINYQAAARDAEGNVLSNKELSFKITLAARQGQTTNTYSEIHHLTSDDLGLVNFVIGRGEIIEGAFDDIPWSEGNVWMEVALDRDNTGNFILLGSNELLSVPYALHARTAGQLIGPNGQSQDPGVQVDDENRAAPTCANATCACDVGALYIELLYNGASVQGPVEFFANNINVSPFMTVNGVQDNDTIKVLKLATLPTNLKIKYNRTGVPGDFDVICIKPGCQYDIVGLSFGPFSVISRMDVVQNLCTIDDGNPAWTLRGNVLQDPVNNFGTLNKEDVVFITSNKDRGTITKDGDFGIGTIEPKALLHVRGGQEIIENRINGDAYNEKAYGLVVNSPDQGIIVRLTNKDGRTLPLSSQPGEDLPTNYNNFITFMGKDKKALGRIEGESGHDANQPDYTNDADWKLELDERKSAEHFANDGVAFASVDFTISVLNGAQDVIEGIRLIAKTAGAAGCTVIDPCISGVLVVSSGARIVIFAAKIAIAITDVGNKTATLASAVAERDDIQDFNVRANSNKVEYRGVVYASGGADYAEFLERAMVSEKMQPGDVVGVNSGKVSLITQGAHEFRVITTNPVVLGNMPPEGDEDLFERVGFLGQVPVKVKGSVNAGDYILPSGNNDGYAIAKTAEEMEIEDFTKIIGRSWSTKSSEDRRLINVAVGLNNNDIAVVAQKQQNQIDALSQEMEKILSVIQGQQGSKTSGIDFSAFDHNLPAHKGTYDPSILERMIEVIRVSASIDPTMIGREELVNDPYFQDFIMNETKSQEYMDLVTKVMEVNGYEIVAASNPTNLMKGQSFSPSFFDFDATSMYDEFANRDPKTETDPRMKEILNDPAKQDQVVKSIQIGQATMKILMGQ